MTPSDAAPPVGDPPGGPALSDSEARVRAVFEHSPVALTLFDASAGRFAEVNDAALAMFGYTRDEMLALTPGALGGWDEPARVAEARARLAREGRASHWEAMLRRKDGTRFPAVLHFSDMDVAGVRLRLAVIEDVSARRELQERALQAQKLQVVGQLAGGVAHDFNNVLTVITNTAELALLDTRVSDPAHEALQTIQRASTRAAQLTARLLAFARRQILHPAALDLNDVVRDLAAMVRGLAGEDVHVAVHLAAGPVVAVADRGSLDQVVLNLAINALDAMPAGGTLTLAVHTAEVTAEVAHGALPPGRYAALAVRDTGVGMTEQVRRRIFEPFFTTKDVGKGTGLGLSMAHGVVTQSGGEITVASAPGAGAAFTVLLPAANRDVTPAVTRPPVAHGHETVLVVDDDADIRTMLARALGRAGYDVAVAGGGDEALRRLAELDGRVDILVTDVKMPGMDGRTLADAARARYPALRVLFTSGYTEDVIADHGVLADGVHFIAKPYTLQALTERIRHVLSA